MFSREKRLIGEENFEKLNNSTVAVIGVGGVGGYVVEALARAGIGNLIIVDGDDIELSNINRQIIATTKTVGMKKVEAWKERILDINPNCNVKAIAEFYTIENKINFDNVDFIVDAIDSRQDKIELICEAQEKDIPILSAMGAGSRIEGCDFAIMDIYKTANDGLAKKLRKDLKARGVKKLATCCTLAAHIKQDGTVGSMSYVPALEGAKMASYVVNELLKI
ncbi:MAG: ThiF family adenylyltransferase [Clostridia bacterium]|nr:ThiF family adenylyltransferase [Clostridia bacterium]